MPQVAEILAQTFQRAGARYLFGHPGGEVTPVIEAARQAGLRFILTRHEAAAAFIAGAWGEVTGQPGLCVSTIGPGASNLLSGVANAFLDRAPLIAVTGQLASCLQNNATHQRMETGRVYAPVVKWSAQVYPETPHFTAVKAWRLSQAGPQGPVHLEVGSDVAANEATAEPWTEPNPHTYEGHEFGKGDLEMAAALISRSDRPVILAGLGFLRTARSRRVRACRALRKFAEAFGLPVVLAPKAKGVFPEDHPLYAGVIDMLGGEQVAGFIRRADLIIAAGFDVVELIKPWGFTAPVLHIDARPNVDWYYPSEVEVAGDLASAIEELAQELSHYAAWRNGWEPGAALNSRRELLDLITGGQGADFLRAVRGSVSPGAPAAAAPGASGRALAGWEVVLTARSALPRNAVATCDVGAHKLLAGQLWEAYAPGTFFMSNGLSSMGYGLPAAAAAKLAHPETPAVAFLGDGGFGMYLGEIETLVRERLAPIVIVLNDGALSLIKINQERRGYPTVGVDFGSAGEPAGPAGEWAGEWAGEPTRGPAGEPATTAPLNVGRSYPDYAGAARCLGAHAFSVQTVAELQKALAESLRLTAGTARPAVIEALVDSGPYRL